MVIIVAGFSVLGHEFRIAEFMMQTQVFVLEDSTDFSKESSSWEEHIFSLKKTFIFRFSDRNVLNKSVEFLENLGENVAGLTLRI